MRFDLRERVIGVGSRERREFSSRLPPRAQSPTHFLFFLACPKDGTWKGKMKLYRQKGKNNSGHVYKKTTWRIADSSP